MRICLLLLFTMGIALLSSLQINGDINQSIVWSEDVYINSDVVVTGTSVLTVNPGINVVFTGNYALEFNDEARIIAGGEGNSVRFTADWDNDSTFGETGVNSERWHGIKFMNMDSQADSSYFTNCIFEYGYKDGSGSESDELNGGAVYIDHFYKTEFNNCSFRNNSVHGVSSAMGGAVYLNWGGSIFRNCSFYDNSSTVDFSFRSDGGAIYGVRHDIELYNCHFSGNTVDDRGGALTFIEGSFALLYNVIMDNNEANSGGALFAENTSLYVSNATIADNHASSGGALYNRFCDALYGNCIIYGNTVSFRGSQVYNYSSDPVFNSCLIEGADTSFYNEGNCNYAYDADCINLNPLFDNSNPNMPYYLSSDSPAIDSGVEQWYSSFYLYDYLLNPRIANDIIDMGAYEIVGNVLLQETQLQFGGVNVDSSRILICYLYNRGMDAVNIIDYEIDNNAFSISNDEVVLPAEDSLLIRVTFAPNSMGVSNGGLTIRTDAGDFVIRLSGNGLERIINYEFGIITYNCLLGESREIELLLENNGNLGLEITQLNSNNPNLTITEPLPVTIDADSYVEVSCLYTPDTLGREDITIAVTSNAHNQQVLNVVINGVGDKLPTPQNVQITNNESVIELNWDEVSVTEYGYSIEDVTYLIDISATPSFDQYERINCNNNSHQYIPGENVKQAWFRVLARHISN